MEDRRPRLPARPLVLFIRYGLGWMLVIAGFVLLIVNPGGFGLDGFGMTTGSGLSVLLLNYLYRLGVSGDDERRREEEARVFLATHGRWPDEPPRPGAAPPPGVRDGQPGAGSEPPRKPGRDDPHRHRPADGGHPGRRRTLARERGHRRGDAG